MCAFLLISFVFDFCFVSHLYNIFCFYTTQREGQKSEGSSRRVSSIKINSDHFPIQTSRILLSPYSFPLLFFLVFDLFKTVQSEANTESIRRTYDKQSMIKKKKNYDLRFIFRIRHAFQIIRMCMPLYSHVSCNFVQIVLKIRFAKWKLHTVSRVISWIDYVVVVIDKCDFFFFLFLRFTRHRRTLTMMARWHHNRNPVKVQAVRMCRLRCPHRIQPIHLPAWRLKWHRWIHPNRLHTHQVNELSLTFPTGPIEWSQTPDDKKKEN